MLNNKETLLQRWNEYIGHWFYDNHPWKENKWCIKFWDKICKGQNEKQNKKLNAIIIEILSDIVDLEIDMIYETVNEIYDSSEIDDLNKSFFELM